MARLLNSAAATRICIGLFLAALISIALLLADLANRNHFAFVVDVWARHGVTLQLASDRGEGWHDFDSWRVAVAGRECHADVTGSCPLAPVAFALSPGRYDAFRVFFRLDPAIRGSQFLLRNPRIIDADQRVLRTFAADSVASNGQLSVKLAGETITVSVPAGAPEPALELAFPHDPLWLSSLSPQLLIQAIIRFLIAAIVCTTAVFIVFALAKPLRDFIPRLDLGRRSWMYGSLILAVAIAAVSVSTYPVVFFKRSYTAPQLYDVALIYPEPPFIPGGERDAPNENIRAVDVGAFAWQYRPWTVVEAHTILDEHEFPLWNRYNLAGAPLLGQGVTQMADPLNWIPIIGRGSALSWDVKFLLAKVLFVVANVLLALRCTRSLPLSLAVGASSAFIGMFLFRINHGGYFTACYAPWLLLGWIWLATTSNRRLLLVAVVVLLLSSLGILGSGALKEGVAMMLCVNVTGLVILLLNRMPWAPKVRRVAVATLAGGAILLLCFPVWSSFIATLRGAVTLSDSPHAYVLPISLIGGLFDDSLYARISLQRFPSLNLLLGVGVLWAIVSARRFARDPIFVGLLTGAALSALFAYGLIPPPLIARLPFIGKMQHVHDAFAGPIIIFAIPLAAYGLRAMTEIGDDNLWRRRHWITAALLVVLALAALFVPFDPVRILGSPLVPDVRWQLLVFIAALVAAAVCIAPLTRTLLRGDRPNAIAVTALMLCLFLLHFRQGMQLETGIEKLDRIMLDPGPRPDFSVPSPALARLPDAAVDPYRIVGLGETLAPGYSAALGLEGIGGPDPLVPANYGELLSAFHFPMEWGWSVRISSDLVKRLSRVLDLLNVRYVAGMPGAAEALSPLPTAVRADLDIVARPTAWPRAYFTDDVRSFANIDALAEMIEGNEDKPFAAVSTSDAAAISAVSASTPRSQVTVAARNYRLTSQSTRFEVEAPGPGIIVLGEQCVDGFHAIVNGVERPIVCVNAVSKGVVVDRPGTYSVEFVFDPRYWQLTPYAVGMGAVVLLLALWLAYRWWPTPPDRDSARDKTTFKTFGPASAKSESP